MEQTKIINKIDSVFLTKVLVLVGIIIFAPFLKNQMITGTLVNCVLFVSVILMGRSTALGLCVFPSIISLATGLLPMAMAPVIPFIIISNMVLVLTFDFLRKNQYLAVALAALFKFAFLFLTSSYIVNILKIQKVAVMFSYPQFFTALAGGVLAIMLIRNNRENVV